MTKKRQLIAGAVILAGLMAYQVASSLTLTQQVLPAMPVTGPTGTMMTSEQVQPAANVKFAPNAIQKSPNTAQVENVCIQACHE